jgi:molybdopterin molybdotransferase
MIPDDPAGLSAALKRALAEADMVLVSGGVSEGAYDYVPRAISECGLQIHFSRVAVKPGKPTTFATGNGRILFGLPGNPVAVYLMFHLFVLRAVSQLCGGTYHPQAFKMRMARDFTRRSALRAEYHPCRISAEGLAEPIEYHGSGHLVALMQADGFFIIPQGVQSLSAGVEVTFVQFEGARS